MGVEADITTACNRPTTSMTPETSAVFSYSCHVLVGEWLPQIVHLNTFKYAHKMITILQLGHHSCSCGSKLLQRLVTSFLAVLKRICFSCTTGFRKMTSGFVCFCHHNTWGLLVNKFASQSRVTLRTHFRLYKINDVT